MKKEGRSPPHEVIFQNDVSYNRLVHISFLTLVWAGMVHF